MVLISSCVDAKLRKSMTKTIERLGGSVTALAVDFTVFVTLEPAKGQKERGFVKSLNTLSALASGMLRPNCDGASLTSHVLQFAVHYSFCKQSQSPGCTVLEALSQ